MRSFDDDHILGVCIYCDRWIMRHSYIGTWLLWNSFFSYMYALDTGHTDEFKTHLVLSFSNILKD